MRKANIEISQKLICCNKVKVIINYFGRCMLEHTQRQVKVLFLFSNAFISPYVYHLSLLFVVS